jgi:hypothetical protein
VTTVYVIAVISSINCGVDVLCLRAAEPDLRYYAQDACIAALNRLIATAKHDTTRQLNWRCVPADTAIAGGLIGPLRRLQCTPASTWFLIETLPSDQRLQVGITFPSTW